MSSEVRQPLLLHRLRTALSHLYSLHNVSHSSNQHEAHNYLIEFQSRNIRRKVTSLHQRKRDSQTELSAYLEPTEETNGSSFLASLPFLLFTTTSHETERLFCAQTILYRLRRMKTSEAVDLEMEWFESPHMNVNSLAEVVSLSPTQSADQNIFSYWIEFVKFHGESISSFHVSLLGRVLQDHFHEFSNLVASGTAATTTVSFADLEEKIKGEITLLILAVMAYLNALAHASYSIIHAGQNNDSMQNLVPILDTLSSAMSVVSLKLRYTTSSVAMEKPSSDIPIVKMVLQTFQKVYGIASSQLCSDLLIGVINHDDSTSHTFREQNQNLHQMALSQCICVALASIPDALLGSPGGARGRLSVDPKCIVAANSEMRCDGTGIGLVKEAIVFLMDSSSQDVQKYVRQQILIMSERWARFVPLPLEYVHFTISTVMPYAGDGSGGFNHFDHALCAYLIQIYEGASMTIDQLMASAAGITAELNCSGHQLGKKKQSSKSKKRHKEKLDDVLNGDEAKRQEAESEAFYRGRVACHAAIWTWDFIHSHLTKDLEFMERHPEHEVDGEGSVGCICSCVAACIPHFVSHGPISVEDVSDSIKLFGFLTEAMQKVCSSQNRSVRALVYENLAAVHSALVNGATATNPTEIQMMAVQFICKCLFILSERCKYPDGYFVDLSRNNDEDIEIERNDVRDLVRAVCALDLKASQSAHISLIIMDSILQYCVSGALDQDQNQSIPSETSIHLLSATAKPLQYLIQMLNQGHVPDFEMVHRIVNNALDCLSQYCEKLLRCFSQMYAINETLPISRLVCITIAAFAPLFSGLVELSSTLQKELHAKAERTIGLAVLAIMSSVLYIPELTAVSSLGNTRYDIRGAMRAPGGEDHCGCIALMRLVKTGESLTMKCVECAARIQNTSIVLLYQEMTKIYNSLLQSEAERASTNVHGSGVTPTSRRVYLSAMTDIGVVTTKKHPETTQDIFSTLNDLFQKSINAIMSCTELVGLTQTQKYFVLCEASFDLSAFPPSFCGKLFDKNSLEMKATELLIEACISGFYQDTNEEPSEPSIYWGRLRGGVVALLRSSADPGFSEFAVEGIKALISSECNAILSYCQQNADVLSSIFHEQVIGDDSLPAGAVLITVRDAIISVHRQVANQAIDRECERLAISSFVSILYGCKDSVFRATSSHTYIRLTTWVDPRPTVLEAWLLSTSEMIKLSLRIGVESNRHIQQLVGESLSLCVKLLLQKCVEKETPAKGHVETLSLDGPQTLAMVEFFEHSFKIGKSVLEVVAKILTVELQLDSCQTVGRDTSLVGGGIIIASIYRCVSGAVPPWAIENIPALFESLFVCCGHELNSFYSMICIGAELKIIEPYQYGSVRSALAGYYFDTMKLQGKEEFMKRAQEILESNSNDRWRKLKVLVKSACGGKKKASDFNLKPQYTNWDCDRL